MSNGEIKVILDSFIELRRRLNGECRPSCPRHTRYRHSINIKLRRYLKKTDIICNNCKSFHFLSCLYADKDCPCNRGINKHELFFYLDEYIEDLEQSLTKIYN